MLEMALICTIQPPHSFHFFFHDVTLLFKPSHFHLFGVNWGVFSLFVLCTLMICYWVSNIYIIFYRRKEFFSLWSHRMLLLTYQKHVPSLSGLFHASQTSARGVQSSPRPLWFRFALLSSTPALLPSRISIPRLWRVSIIRIMISRWGVRTLCP